MAPALPIQRESSKASASNRTQGSPSMHHALTLSTSAIAPKVHWIRHEKVILDFDLAALYGVETRALKQAVRRNRARFPADFLFILSTEEIATLVSQSVIPGRGKFGGAAPYGFTEQGVAMLSSVLRSPRAVHVNIAIMRTFVQLRRIMDSNRDLARKIEALEQKYDERFRAVFEAIKRLIAAERIGKRKPHREIGFHTVRRAVTGT